MSNQPPPEAVVTDALVSADLAAFNSPSRSRTVIKSRTILPTQISSSIEHMDSPTSELAPLLGSGNNARVKKPFYRARPLWLVPFAVTAALVRGMTIAPRIEVFTQLSCGRLHHHYNHTTSISNLLPPHATLFSTLDPSGPHLRPSDLSSNASLVFFPGRFNDVGEDDGEGEGEDDPRRLPSPKCVSDPAVVAGAARLQMVMTFTMGFLSALTTGWWGHFGERHGRTKVLAIATFGLFLTDLTFILVSTPGSPLSSHSHKLLYLAPVIEGLLGGWSTLQSGTSAYISDCTSSGSRASVFSRFTGVFYIGFSVGPSIGGWLIRHPISFLPGTGGTIVPGQGQTVTSVFWVAICCSFINFILVLLVFPESLSEERRALASGKGKSSALPTVPDAETEDAVAVDGVAVRPRRGIIRRIVGSFLASFSFLLTVAVDKAATRPGRGIIGAFLSPLAIFLPVDIPVEGSTRKRKDWSLTLLAGALFGYFLSSGVYQLKYLYAEHVYEWGAEQLSYYISFQGAMRALFLLFAMPLIISTFKPKSKIPKANPETPGKVKPKPTKAHLAQEINFDLILTRFSLLTDFVANAAILIAPAPMYQMHQLAGAPSSSVDMRNSQILFVLASCLTSFGSGIVPAAHSLALCLIQARALLARGSEPNTTTSAELVEGGTGPLFGALAVLQAVGQMIIGPMLFGLIYSGTVATFPKTIFATAAGILVASLACLLLIRAPVSVPPKGKNAALRRRRQQEEEVERGRSRVSKDLRGHEYTYGSVTEPPIAGPSGS